jgi:hypothetical protein
MPAEATSRRRYHAVPASHARPVGSTFPGVAELGSATLEEEREKSARVDSLCAQKWRDWKPFDMDVLVTEAGAVDERGTLTLHVVERLPLTRHAEVADA